VPPSDRAPSDPRRRGFTVAWPRDPPCRQDVIVQLLSADLRWRSTPLVQPLDCPRLNGNLLPVAGEEDEALDLVPGNSCDSTYSHTTSNRSTRSNGTKPTASATDTARLAVPVDVGHIRPVPAVQLYFDRQCSRRPDLEDPRIAGSTLLLAA
jgi:hypothetical protein